MSASASPFSHSDAIDIHRQFEERKARAEAEMARLMDEAVVLVRGKAETVENDMLRPAYQSYQTVAKEYPTTTVFLMVFGLLSVVPIAMFITFAVIIFSTFIFGAVTTAVIGAGVIVGFAGSILLFVLSFTTGTAAFVTLSYIAVTLASRLVFHLHNTDGKGLNGWLEESLSRYGLGASVSLTRGNQVPQGGNLDFQIVTDEKKRLSDGWDSVDHANHPSQHFEVKSESIGGYTFPRADAPGI